MSRKRSIAIGIGAFGASIAALESVPQGEFASIAILVFVGGLAAIGLIGGPRLPLAIRLFSTLMIFYFGYGMSLVGRTEGPGLTRLNVISALGYFVTFALLPGTCLVRLWPLRKGLVVFAALLPVSLAAAMLVAGIEECLFVQKYGSTGVGPTPRWTVSTHWLSYDREAQRLDGSD